MTRKHFYSPPVNVNSSTKAMQSTSTGLTLVHYNSCSWTGSKWKHMFSYIFSWTGQHIHVFFNQMAPKMNELPVLRRMINAPYKFLRNIIQHVIKKYNINCTDISCLFFGQQRNVSMHVLCGVCFRSELSEFTIFSLISLFMFYFLF